MAIFRVLTGELIVVLLPVFLLYCGFLVFFNMVVLPTLFPEVRDESEQEVEQCEKKR